MDVKTIVGYHGTTSDNAISILKNGFKISKDKYCKLYLGRGIYFYIEYKDSISWVIKKYRTNHKLLPNIEDLNNEYKIIKTEMVLNEDNILDLDKVENIKIFDEFVNSLEDKLLKEKEYKMAKNKNGAIINYLIRVNYLEGVDIVVRSIRDKIEISDCYSFNDIYRKVICVKNKNIIKSNIIKSKILEEDFDLVKYFFESKSKVV